MIKITNGAGVIEVTNGAYEDIYKHHGYYPFDEVVEDDSDQDEDDREDNDDDNNDDKVEKVVFDEEDKAFLETPFAQWKKVDVEAFVKKYEIDTTEAKNFGDAKQIVKEFADANEQE